MKGLFIPEITAEMFRNGCLESIEALIDGTPLLKGQWIDRSGGDPTDFSVSCNLCNEWFPRSTNFCPNCGAKMEEKI